MSRNLPQIGGRRHSRSLPKGREEEKEKTKKQNERKINAINVTRVSKGTEGDGGEEGTEVAIYKQLRPSPPPATALLSSISSYRKRLRFLKRFSTPVSGFPRPSRNIPLFKSRLRHRRTPVSRLPRCAIFYKNYSLLSTTYPRMQPTSTTGKLVGFRTPFP